MGTSSVLNSPRFKAGQGALRFKKIKSWELDLRPSAPMSSILKVKGRQKEAAIETIVPTIIGGIVLATAAKGETFAILRRKS